MHPAFVQKPPARRTGHTTGLVQKRDRPEGAKGGRVYKRVLLFRTLRGAFVFKQSQPGLLGPAEVGLPIVVLTVLSGYG